MKVQIIPNGWAPSVHPAIVRYIRWCFANLAIAESFASEFK